VNLLIALFDVAQIHHGAARAWLLVGRSGAF